MNEARQTLIDWLRDAHALETHLITTLDMEEKRTKPFPMMHKRVAAHAEESRRHAELLEQCLDRLGSDTSTAKDLMGKIAGSIMPMTAAAARDEPVKTTLTNISMEHFEIACYRSLIAAAEHCGEAEIAEVARSICKEEEAMAEWLQHQLPDTTRTYLAHSSGLAVNAGNEGKDKT